MSLPIGSRAQEIVLVDRPARLKLRLSDVDDFGLFVRVGTILQNADHDIGQWNTFQITMKGDRLTVVLNGITVIDRAQLPGVPARGPIALQHHGSKNPENGEWWSPPALVQFKNIYVKEL